MPGYPRRRLLGDDLALPRTVTVCDSRGVDRNSHGLARTGQGASIHLAGVSAAIAECAGWRASGATAWQAGSCTWFLPAPAVSLARGHQAGQLM